MLSFLKRHAKSVSRTVQVGWIIDTERAGFIWPAPQRVSRDDPPNLHAKSVRYCPAVLDHEARLFEIACPIDAHISFRLDKETNQMRLANGAGDQSPIRSKQLNQMLSLVSRKEWRDPSRPMLQITTPYIFLADEPVYMTQLPPFGHYFAKPWPGVMIAGRLPIHIWPRKMMWAFEWFDPTAGSHPQARRAVVLCSVRSGGSLAIRSPCRG